MIAGRPKAAASCPNRPRHRVGGFRGAAPRPRDICNTYPLPPPKPEKTKAFARMNANHPKTTLTNTDPLYVVGTTTNTYNSTGESGVFGVFWPSYTRTDFQNGPFKTHAVSPKHPEYPEHPGLHPDFGSPPAASWGVGDRFEPPKGGRSGALSAYNVLPDKAIDGFLEQLLGEDDRA